MGTLRKLWQKLTKKKETAKPVKEKISVPMIPTHWKTAPKKQKTKLEKAHFGNFRPIKLLRSPNSK